MKRRDFYQRAADEWQSTQAEALRELERKVEMQRIAIRELQPAVDTYVELARRVCEIEDEMLPLDGDWTDEASNACFGATRTLNEAMACVLVHVESALGDATGDDVDAGELDGILQVGELIPDYVLQAVDRDRGEAARLGRYIVEAAAEGHLDSALRRVEVARLTQSDAR